MGEQYHQAEEIEPVVPYLEHIARNNRYQSSYNNSRAGFFVADDDRSGGKKGKFDGKDKKSRGGKKIEAGMSRLFLNVGSDDNVLPQHIVKAVCSHSSLSGKQIGAIAIYGRYTFVDVPREAADEVVKNLTGRKIGNRPVRAEKQK